MIRIVRQLQTCNGRFFAQPGLSIVVQLWLLCQGFFILYIVALINTTAGGIETTAAHAESVAAAAEETTATMETIAANAE